MKDIKKIAENPNSTVVSEFESSKKRATSYQSEAELENAFIELLQSQAYEYIKINNDADLSSNIRTQLEKLNDYKFSDSEWQQFFKDKVCNKRDGISEKAFKIQNDYIQLLKRDNGSEKNIYLINKENIHKNTLQVINQYEAEGKRQNRYDVTILVNGLPLIHVELKRRGVEIREAFNQIRRYQRDSFWADNGLFEYVQLFVISNGTHTKYYSNTTRSEHIKQTENQGSYKGQNNSHSFEFTCWWSAADNKPIFDLMDFGKTFFAKHTILNILTKYCVLTADNQLLAMRPYQIVATERILNKIEISTNYKQLGTVESGGYVWHTTGSGKTLTSFKAAQLATNLEYIDKVIFVVDRKDLDYQTMKEYDKFQKGAANSNTSTAELKKNLDDPGSKIIITTIQKLDRFIKKNKGHKIFEAHVVLIFDECHRSQFGDMHKSIVTNFKNYHLFGFTGTPIFAKNASSGGKISFKTTEQAFGDKLHTYTIVNAIDDKNVLPFKTDYISTFKEAEGIQDSKVSDIDRERALASPKRISNIVEYILKNNDAKTYRHRRYSMEILEEERKKLAKEIIGEEIAPEKKTRNTKTVSGFNSIFAVSSIDFAKLYYLEFKKQQQHLIPDRKLKVATIFSYSPNEGEFDGLDDENPEDTSGLNASSRDFLEGVIDDYNEMFGTSYDTSSDKFQSYYKDVSLRMKNREIDILIVVNMYLTGFDAKTLNTLWIDKNLKMHGLLQAFSRTNRILNSIKQCGNIISFRNLEEATNQSLALFGDKEASGTVLLKTFEEYYIGYENDGKMLLGYVDLVEQLENKFPLGEKIFGETNQKEFIKLFSQILSLMNILSIFDEFAGKEKLSERDLQDYRSVYIDLYHEFRQVDQSEKADINDDIVFEMELIKQVEINIDYIFELITKYASSNKQDREVLNDINRAINSSTELRDKKELIEKFISSINAGASQAEDWQDFVEEQKLAELNSLIEVENLDKEATYKFIENSFRNGEVQISGTGVSEILPPISRFSHNDDRSVMKQRVLDKIKDYFNRFYNISGENL